MYCTRVLPVFFLNHLQKITFIHFHKAGDSLQGNTGTGYLKLNWKGNEIDDSFGNIEVENRNTTAGYGGVYWQYFEDLDNIKDHSESPLNVEKELYLNVSDQNGKSLKRISAETPLKIGCLVTVRLVVRSTADMDYTLEGYARQKL